MGSLVPPSVRVDVPKDDTHPVFRVRELSF